MLATLHKLGVIPSFSRPSVSNDNPYSESLFRTMKYRPEYPLQPFENIEQAQSWVDGFVFWYNTQHLLRWSKNIRNWNPVHQVWLNPEKWNEISQTQQLKKAA